MKGPPAYFKSTLQPFAAAEKAGGLKDVCRVKMGVDTGPSETSHLIISDSTDKNKDSVLIRNDVKFQLLLIL